MHTCLMILYLINELTELHLRLVNGCRLPLCFTISRILSAGNLMPTAFEAMSLQPPTIPRLFSQLKAHLLGSLGMADRR